jgi:hypothetical protein
MLERPYTPFAFLEGRELVPEQPVPSLYAPLTASIQGYQYVQLRACYALPSDFGVVLSRAVRELVAKGFERYSADRASGYYCVSYMRKHTLAEEDYNPNPRGHTLVPIDSIGIFEDMRYRTARPSEPYGAVGEKAPGWTSVSLSVWIPQRTHLR